jgi:hypothetical protein
MGVEGVGDKVMLMGIVEHAKNYLFWKISNYYKKQMCVWGQVYYMVLGGSTSSYEVEIKYS